VLLKGGVDAAFVTVAINRVEFKKPVLVGDVVSFQTSVVRVGRTSITMKVDVFAERGAERINVTDAEVVYVGVDPATPPTDRRPVPLLPPAGG
jgi:acyl-CoA thioesterase YciA